MAHHFHAHSRMSRTAAAVMVLASLFPGCSGEGTPPAPARPESGGGKQAVSAPIAEKKVKKLRPGQQAPGTAGYEDKPGDRGRGR